MSWRDQILNESAQIGKLAKSPARIMRVGKTRRTACEGGCGRRVWLVRCRKCRRKLVRAQRKDMRRAR